MVTKWARMSPSWNHTVRRMTDEEIEQRTRLGWSCAGPLCPEEALYAVTFDSVTGRAGRVNTRQKSLCPSHAAKFAANHGLEMPSAV